MKEEYITLKNIQIPIIIKSYKTSKSVKIFFKNDKITITKPTKLSKKNLSPIIKKNEEFIYNTYLDGLRKNNENKKCWETGEKIFYRGEEFEIFREINEKKQIHIDIREDEKQIKVTFPNSLNQEDIKPAVDRRIKQIFKNNTENVLQERLPYWSKITGIKYHSFIVRDASTRYGSCVFKTRTLRFSSRLIMLSQRIIDAIIVHELCHIIYPNHSKDFYDLVKKYVPNYKEVDKWLHNNSRIIII